MSNGNTSRLKIFFKTLFFTQSKPDYLVIALFLAINLIVFINMVIHNPEMGYDAEDHLDYLIVLPDGLPGPDDTREFFSPPLPYLIPGWMNRACLVLNGGLTPETFEVCRDTAGKTAQGINLLLSLGTSLLFLQISEILRPGNHRFKLAVLLLVGCLTVYYKTFAQVRGEPYVVFFTLWALALIASWIRPPTELNWKDGVRLGVVLGLLILSRQWGFTLFPALGLLVLVLMFLVRSHAWQIIKVFALSLGVAFMVGGWYYLHLFIQYDSFTAFNRASKGFSLSNQPYEFYRHTGLQDGRLFRNPTRREFDNEFFPLFYSEMWGDYWGYHVFIRDKSYLGVLGYANQAEINPYLGRVNLVSLYPTLLYALSLVTGLLGGFRLFKAQGDQRSRLLYNLFLGLFVTSSMLLYMYFLISYPNLEKGDTIKATYMLNALLALPLLGADFLEKTGRISSRLQIILMTLLGLVWVFNLPAMISRYFSI